MVARKLKGDVGPALAGKAVIQTINVAWMYWPLPS